jgi:4-methyl-5(b-hydroxyethyl)-thiazole monophosphate biosynthesis
MSEKTAVIFLAPGFEEIEAVSVYDILKRAGIHTTLAGSIAPHVQGAHGLSVQVDCTIQEAVNRCYDVAILPGGEKGVAHLSNEFGLLTYLENHAKANKWIAAICAAPGLLAKQGLLDYKKVTSYPSIREQMKNCIYQEEEVVIDPPFITSRGPATSMAFAYAILRSLELTEVANHLETAMLMSYGLR